MTTIQPHTTASPTADPAREARGRRDGGLAQDDLARRDPRREAGREEGGAGLGLGLSHGTAEGEREERFRRALKRLGTDDGAPEEEGPSRSGTRLLAEREPLALWPTPAAPAAAPEARAHAPSLAERSERVAALVDETLRADLRLDPGAALTVRLDAAALRGSGLASVAVTLAPGVVEVFLQREAGEDGAALMAGAQALADRLQTRFGRRVVRVHEGEPPAASSLAPDGRPSGVFALFGRETGA